MPTASPNISYLAAKAVATLVKWEVVDGRVTMAVKLLLTLDLVAETLLVPTTTVDCLGVVVIVAKEETAKEITLAPEFLIIVILRRAEDKAITAEVMAIVVATVTELAIIVNIIAFRP